MSNNQQEITLTRDDLAKMSQGQLTRLLMASSKIRATAVVIDKDGNIKYDDPSKAGTFGEEVLKHG